MANLFIRRTRQWSFGLVPIRVLLNGREVGRIKSGDSLELSIEEGNHILQAVFLRTGSNIIDLNAGYGSIYYYELGSDVNMMRNLMEILKHPFILLALYLIDKLVHWDYFLFFGLLAYLAYELSISLYRKKLRKLHPEPERYYIYLKELK